MARLLAPATLNDEPKGIVLLAQIRRVAAQAKHFDGLLDELPSRDSGLRGVDFGDDLTDLTRSPP